MRGRATSHFLITKSEKKFYGKTTEVVRKEILSPHGALLMVTPHGANFVKMLKGSEM